MPQLIELAQNRKLSLRIGGARCSLIVAPISEAVWFEQFFDKITSTIECDPVRSDSYVDVESAGANLIKKTVVGFEGFPQLEGLPDWQSKIPFKFRSAFGGLLVELMELPKGEGENPAAAAAGALRSVRLKALWGATPTGAMGWHKDLVHFFNAPSAQHRDCYRRAATAVRRTVGFTRRGPAVFLSPEQACTAHTLAALYDELIVSVEGYAANGEPLNDDRARIIGNMDTFHKVRAARFLFSQDFAHLAASAGSQSTWFCRRWGKRR